LYIGYLITSFLFRRLRLSLASPFLFFFGRWNSNVRNDDSEGSTVNELHAASSHPSIEVRNTFELTNVSSKEKQ
jgi:hypothetical protein